MKERDHVDLSEQYRLGQGSAWGDLSPQGGKTISLRPGSLQWPLPFEDPFMLTTLLALGVEVVGWCAMETPAEVPIRVLAPTHLWRFRHN